MDDFTTQDQAVAGQTLIGAMDTVPYMSVEQRIDGLWHLRIYDDDGDLYTVLYGPTQVARWILDHPRKPLDDSDIPF